ncbi:MAG: hypothetical protein AMXMBFR34_46840 [Myxococcaceae bacterium]
MSAPAGVIELSLRGRGPSRAFVFDPHRLALPCWAMATGGKPALLVTLDRHFDTVPPTAPPKPGWTIAQYDEHVRTRLDERNVDHLLAAMEAGLVGDAILFARTHPVGSVQAQAWTDSRGGVHHLLASSLVDPVACDFGTERASPEGKRARELLRRAERVLLDVDLDCFTSPSDADPTTVVPWPEEVITQHLLPRGSEAFWGAVLEKCVGLTFAREPGHCGGLLASRRLFEVAARVVFERLLRTDVP